MIEFEKWPKISRVKKGETIITEKIDGTNAQICIFPTEMDVLNSMGNIPVTAEVEGRLLVCGSRNRWIHPDKDNFGFATWVRDNADRLCRLGWGRHYGEWWGQGIQRTYDMGSRVFSLFNTSRWTDEGLRAMGMPDTVRVVPILGRGPGLSTEALWVAMGLLKAQGSHAAPGFMDPEGCVLFHTESRVMLKAPFEEEHKGEAADTTG